jgi:muramidase (phage lysozyme)
MANSSLALGSSLNLKRINKSVNSLSESVRRAQSSSANISKSLIDSNRNKRKSLSLSSTLFRRRREANLRREREDIIEAGSVVGAIRRTGKVAMSSTKGFLGRILDYLGTVLIGWAVTNLPAIISMAQDLIGRMQKYFGILQDFVNGMFTNITGFIERIGETIGNINVFQFGTVKEIFDNAVDKMKNAFISIENGVAKIINRIAKIDTIKDLVDYLNKFEGFTFDINKFNIPGLPKIFGSDEPLQPEKPGSRTGAASQGTAEQRALLDAVAFAEGTSKSYGTISGGGINKDLEAGKLTVQQAIDLGNSYGRPGSQHKWSGATGRYQFMPFTLAGLVKSGKLKAGDLFTPAMQDKAAIMLIEKRGVTAAMLKKEGLSVRVADLLAPEFASFPYSPKGGRSYYDQSFKDLKSLQEVYKRSLGTQQSRQQLSKVQTTGSASDRQTITYPDGTNGTTQTYKPGETLINRLPTTPFSENIAMAPKTGRDILIINRSITEIQQAARAPQQQQGTFEARIAMVNNIWDKMQFTALT